MDRQYLQRQFAQGRSLEQVGAELGLHPSSVSYWAKRYDLAPPGSERFSPRGQPDRELLTRLVTEEATLREISDQLHRSSATVRYWLRKWNIERPQRRRRADPETAPQTLTRHCPKHGNTTFGLERRGYYRCLRCRQERVSAWRRKVKRTLIDEAGGRCALCGYDNCEAALQFHHTDPATKSFALSDDGIARNIARARQEAAKCVLLCANCHAEVEAGHRELTK